MTAGPASDPGSHDFDDVDALKASAEGGLTGLDDALHPERPHRYPEGEGPLSVLILGLGLFFLFALPLATRSGPESQGWWTQPWLAPLCALVVMIIAGTAHVLFLRRAQLGRLTFVAAARLDLHDLRQPLELALWFALYALGVGTIGYTLSTFAFLVLVLWRSQLTGLRWLLISAAMTCLLLLVFRVGLRIWLPPADVYGLLPDALRQLALTYF